MAMSASPSPATDDAAGSPDEVRTRIVDATAALIAASGRDAATTRAVAAAAGVQAPTIYRLFGDKRGLLNAVVEDRMSRYVAEKAVRTTHVDPVQDLRAGWDTHVAFGLAHPGLFGIMSCDPPAHPGASSITAGFDVLRRRIRRIALAGRLKVGEERAAALLHSACVGTVLTLLGMPEAARDPGLSAAAREAILQAIAGEADPAADALGEPAGAGAPARTAASTLHASLDTVVPLSAGERQLLRELLDRIANAG